MPNTIFVGKVLLSLDELPSTNDYLRQWVAGGVSDTAAKSGPPEGTVVRAVRQSAGRGQYGSTWLSAPGENLTFSLLFHPVWLPVHRQFRLSMAVATACLLEAHWRIKWPNDIYIGDRKAAGILIENQVQGSTLASSVVGIGLNVNQTQFPPELPNPGSMALDAGHAFDLEEVLDRLLVNLEQRYLQLRAGHEAQIVDAYRARLYGLDERRDFQLADGTLIQGLIRDVTPEGKLLLETPSDMLEFQPKEIRFL